ncbi:leucine--tRNA ligase [Patescibacteria group bacterium]|nr:leucine--tRNA ligase [Patescibacteria group bacterium]
MKPYDHKKIEAKWQKRWEQAKLFEPDIAKAKKPFYNLMMFPYPSGEGLHVGHTYAFGGADAYGRFKRLQGYDVFEPMGFDAFGIHSENFAIKKGIHPQELIKTTTTYFREKQMKRYGGMWDWSRQVDTTDPDYYHWTQWLFVKLFKQGLVERKKAPLNWCPSCKTVLSDEQVEAKGDKSVCERCKTEVERKETEQWFFKITQYAERLLDYHGTQWPQTTRQMQTNWIAKKQGINIVYKVEGSQETITCFTTRPDTNFGATFVVLAPEHPIVVSLLKNPKIREYIEKAKNKSELERITEGRKKTGVFTGLYALNNLNGKKMPIWVSDFVLMSVGTGAVIGVPGHDLRDFEFAQQFKLPVVRVVVGSDGDKSEITRSEQVQEAEGIMINSEFLDGLDIHQATEKIMDYFEEKGWGKRVTTYRLRDWCISRQRYWGPPIPMIYCQKCGWVAVPEKDLPVLLPYIKDYQPKGKGQSPLAEIKEFYQVKCPQCGGEARRETDVSDTFLDSAWYFLRYPSVRAQNSNLEIPWNRQITRCWLPVDMYIGGNEHACMHLLYSRFITMALYDMGLVGFQEPFKRFYAHGLIIKDGVKMSKSRGNVVNPEEYMDKYGADALRMYLLFLGQYSHGGDFRDSGMQGMLRFVNRIYSLAVQAVKQDAKLSQPLEKKLHQTIKKVTQDLEKLKFNTAIAGLMELVNLWSGEEGNRELVAVLARLMAPFAPFLAEELWEMSGVPAADQTSDVRGFVLNAGWPKHDEQLTKEELVEIVVQVNGRVREKFKVEYKASSNKQEVLELAQASERVTKHLAGKKVKKVVFVPGRLLNLVT